MIRISKIGNRMVFGCFIVGLNMKKNERFGRIYVNVMIVWFICLSVWVVWLYLYM